MREHDAFDPLLPEIRFEERIKGLSTGPGTILFHHKYTSAGGSATSGFYYQETLPQTTAIQKGLIYAGYVDPGVTVGPPFYDEGDGHWYQAIHTDGIDAVTTVGKGVGLPIAYKQLPDKPDLSSL